MSTALTSPAERREPSETREKALRGLTKLPPFSPILNKLLATLADEDVSFGKLADLIEKDAVLAGNVLRLVNSALYGLRGTINSVRHAVSIMGLAKLRNTTMSMSVSRLWAQAPAPKDWSAATFNQHSGAVAILSDLLVQRVEVDYPEGAFAAGLLHDLGLLLVAISLPEEFERIKEEARQGTPVESGAAAVLGFDHAELSAAALAHWNIPAPIQEAVRRFRLPGAGLSLARVLAAANRIADDLGIRVQKWAPAGAGVPGEAMAELGLEDRAPRILEEFDAEFQAILGFFN